MIRVVVSSGIGAIGLMSRAWIVCYGAGVSWLDILLMGRSERWEEARRDVSWFDEVGE